MALENSFDKTKLDLESNIPGGGPNNAPQYNYMQTNLPTVQNTHYLNLVPVGSAGRLNSTNQYSTTRLDMRNGQPNAGAPINVPNNGHMQKYSQRPGQSYVDSMPGAPGVQ
jgi:hypothetical protein